MVSLGTLEIGLRLDRAQFDQEIATLSRTGMKIPVSLDLSELSQQGTLATQVRNLNNVLRLKPTVEHTELNELNAHFDSKLKHFKQLQTEFDKGLRIKYSYEESGSIKPPVSTVTSSQQTNPTDKELLASLQDLRGTMRGLGTSMRATADLAHEIRMFGKRSQSSGDFSFFDSLKTGFVEEIGATFGRPFTEGIVHTVQGAVGLTMRDIGVKYAEGMVRQAKAVINVGKTALPVLGRATATGMETEGDLSQKAEAFSSEIKKGTPAVAEAFSTAVIEEVKILFYDIGKLIKSYRYSALESIAPDLVKARAEEILRKPDKRAGIRAMTDQTEQLIIASGGYGGVKGISGWRIPGLIDAEYGKDKRRASVGITNTATDIDPRKFKPEEQPIYKMLRPLYSDDRLEALNEVTKLFTLTTKGIVAPNLRGYSPDAVEMAAQATAAIAKNPEIKIKFVGESGGGFNAEEATAIMHQLGLGKNVSGVGIGTPELPASLEHPNFKKYLSTEDPLLGKQTPIETFKKQIPEQQLSFEALGGLQGHEIQHYLPHPTIRKSLLDELSPELSRQEITERFNKFKEQVSKTFVGKSQEIKLPSAAILKTMSPDEIKAKIDRINSFRVSINEVGLSIIAEIDEIVKSIPDSEKMGHPLAQLKGNLTKKISAATKPLKISDAQLRELQFVDLDKIIPQRSSQISGDLIAELSPHMIDLQQLKKTVQAKPLGQEIVGDIAEGMQEDAPVVKSAGEKIIDELRKGMETKKIKVTTGQQVVNDLQVGVKEAAVKIKVAGQQIDQGLAEGIKNDSNKVKISVRKVVDETINAAEEGFEIKSPSKVFERIGQNVVAGLDLGVNNIGGFISNLQGKIKTALNIVTEIAKNQTTPLIFNEKTNALLSQGLANFKTKVSELFTNAQKLFKEIKISGILKPLELEFQGVKKLLKTDEVRSFVGGGLNALKTGFLELTRAIPAAVRQFDSFIREISRGTLSITSFAIGLGIVYTAIKTFNFLLDAFLQNLSMIPYQILDFLGSAQDAALQVERLSVALNFSGIENSTAKLAQIKENSDKIGASFLESAKGYQAFSAAVLGSSLERQTDKIFTSFQEGMVLRGAGKEEQQRTFVALQQMASKSKISAEELVQQLGESLPGALQIAARAMGVTTAQLLAMTKQGSVLADDLLPRMAAQLKRESGMGLLNIKDTSFVAFAKFQNQLESLQLAIGKPIAQGTAGFFNAIVPVLKTLEGIMPQLMAAFNTLQIIGITYVARIAWAFGLLPGPIRLASAAMAVLGTQITLTSAKAMGLAALNIARPFIAFIALDMAMQGFFEAFKKGSDEAIRSTEALAESLQRLKNIQNLDIKTENKYSGIWGGFGQGKAIIDSIKDLKLLGSALDSVVASHKILAQPINTDAVKAAQGALLKNREQIAILKVKLDYTLDPKEQDKIKEQLANLRESGETYISNKFPGAAEITGQIEMLQDMIKQYRKIIVENSLVRDAAGPGTMNARDAQKNIDEANQKLQVAQTHLKGLNVLQDKYNEAIAEGLQKYRETEWFLEKLENRLSNIKYAGEIQSALAENKLLKQGGWQVEIDLKIKENSIVNLNKQIRAISESISKVGNELSSKLTPALNSAISLPLGSDFRKGLAENTLSPESINRLLSNESIKNNPALKEIVDLAQEYNALLKSRIDTENSALKAERELNRIKAERAAAETKARLTESFLKERTSLQGSSLSTADPRYSMAQARMNIAKQLAELRALEKQLVEKTADDPVALRQSIADTKIAILDAQRALLEQQFGYQTALRELAQDTRKTSLKIRVLKKFPLGGQLAERENIKIDLSDLYKRLAELRYQVSNIKYSGKNPADLQREINQTNLSIAESRNRLIQQERAIQIAYRNYGRSLEDYQNSIEDIRISSSREARSITEAYQDLMRSIESQLRQSANELNGVNRDVKLAQLRLTLKPWQARGTGIESIINDFIQFQEEQARLTGERENLTLQRYDIEQQSLDLARQIRGLQEQAADATRNQLRSAVSLARQYQDLVQQWEDLTGSTGRLTTGLTNFADLMDAINQRLSQSATNFGSINEALQRLPEQIRTTSQSSEVIPTISSGVSGGGSANSGGASTSGRNTGSPMSFTSGGVKMKWIRQGGKWMLDLGPRETGGNEIYSPDFLRQSGFKIPSPPASMAKPAAKPKPLAKPKKPVVRTVPRPAIPRQQSQLPSVPRQVETIDDLNRKYGFGITPIPQLNYGAAKEQITQLEQSKKAILEQRQELNRLQTQQSNQQWQDTVTKAIRAQRIEREKDIEAIKKQKGSVEDLIRNTTKSHQNINDAALSAARNVRQQYTDEMSNIRDQIYKLRDDITSYSDFINRGLPQMRIENPKAAAQFTPELLEQFRLRNESNVQNHETLMLLYKQLEATKGQASQLAFIQELDKGRIEANRTLLGLYENLMSTLSENMNPFEQIGVQGFMNQIKAETNYLSNKDTINSLIGKFPDEQIEKMRSLNEAARSLELDNAFLKANPWAQAFNDNLYEAIMNTKSLGDALKAVGVTILQSFGKWSANAITQGLFGSGGLFGGLFGGIFGFNQGGKVGNYASGEFVKDMGKNNIVALDRAIQRERAAGGTPVIGVLSAGEYVVPINEVQGYLAFKNQAKIQNFSYGGIVGGQNLGNNSYPSTSNRTVIINNNWNVQVQDDNQLGFSRSQIEARNQTQIERGTKRFT